MMKNWYLTSLHDHTIQRKGMKTKDKDEASNVDELFPQDVGKWLWGPRVQIEFLTFWVSNRDFHNEKVLRTSMRVTFTCCVIWRSLVVLGRGQKCRLFFFATSDIPISAAFEDTIASKLPKIISVIRKIDWRALEKRARKPRLCPAIFGKSWEFIILHVTYFGAQCARNRAIAPLVHANLFYWSRRWFLLLH